MYGNYATECCTMLNSMNCPQGLNKKVLKKEVKETSKRIKAGPTRDRYTKTVGLMKQNVQSIGNHSDSTTSGYLFMYHQV